MGLFQMTAMIFKNIEILKVRKINLDFQVHRQDEVWMKLSTRRLPNLKCFILILLKSFMKFEIPNPSIHDNDMNLILKNGAYKAPICSKLTKYIHMLLIPLKILKNFVFFEKPS